VIFADADILANPELRAALPDNNRASSHNFAIAPLHAEALRVRIATVSRATHTFLMSHGAFSLVSRRCANPVWARR
jgi:hypothetical protein